MNEQPSPIYLAMERAKKWLLKVDGVAGLGITWGDGDTPQSILIMISKPYQEMLPTLPTNIENFPISIEEVGNIQTHIYE